MRKILILVMSFFVTILFADSITISRNTQQDSTKQKEITDDKTISEVKTMIATGYGLTSDQALKKAFNSAIEQYVGVVVTSETIVLNYTTIKDEIFSASNGYIQTYKVLNETETEGMWETRIEAVVKSQAVYEKIKSLNIDVINLNTNETKDAYARITTKAKTKEEVGPLLQNAFDEFLDKKSLLEMLEVKIDSINIKENKVTKENKVPLDIQYTITLKYESYIQKVRKLEQIFENLGLTQKERIDLPYLESGLKVRNTDKIKAIKNTDFGIIENYGIGYKLDVWEFPEEWEEILPFKKQIFFSAENLLDVIIEIKDGNKNVLLADNISKRLDKRLLLRNINHVYGVDSYNIDWSTKVISVIAPFFSNNANTIKVQTELLLPVESDVFNKMKEVVIEIDPK